jgi:hypothetical protein
MAIQRWDCTYFVAPTASLPSTAIPYKSRQWPQAQNGVYGGLADARKIG